MKKWLYGGAAAFVLTIIMIGGCMASRSAAEISGASKKAVATALPTDTLGALIAANWQGYPLSRPGWCGSPAVWRMASVPGHTKEVVPVCEQIRAIVYLGTWDSAGCTPHVLEGRPSKQNALLLEPSDQLPSYAAYTTCPKVETRIPLNTGLPPTPTPRR